MSYEAVTAVLKRSKSKGTARLIFIIIAHHADRFGCNAYPSLATLRRETGMSVRQVQYGLRSLEESGELICAIKAGPGQANLYTVTLVDNCVDNSGGRREMVQRAAPSNKEEGAGVVQPVVEGGAIDGIQVVQPVAPKHTVNHPEDLKGVDEEARALGEKFSGPISKAHSARRAAHPQGEQPKEGAPSPDLPLPDGLERLADFEALRADPILLAVAGAWVDLQGRPLETLTMAEGEALAAKQAEWGARFTPDDVRKAQQETTLRKAMVQHMYFLAVLDAWAKKPPGNGNGHGHGHARARAAPNGHNGNGHAHVHGPEWNGVENGHIVDGAAYHAYHERLAEVRVVKSGGG